MNIGKALKYYRKSFDLTQAQVAERAEMNEKYYGELERNESSPTIDRLEQISYAFGIDLQQLVGYRQLRETVAEYNCIINKCEKTTKNAYCNCCGCYFTIDYRDIACPECGCQYTEDNGYIEIYNV